MLSTGEYKMEAESIGAFGGMKWNTWPLAGVSGSGLASMPHEDQEGVSIPRLHWQGPLERFCILLQAF